MGFRFLALALAAGLLLPALATPAQAQVGTAAPAPPEWLDARAVLGLASFGEAAVEGDVAVHQVQLQGRGWTARDVREAHRQAAWLGGGEAFVAGVEEALRLRIQDTLEALVPGARVEVARATVEPASLTAPEGSDPFHPPVRITFDATMAFDVEDLTGGAITNSDQVQAALALGARGSLPVALTASPGWNVTYTVQAPAWARFTAAPGGTLARDGSEASWTLANWRTATTQRLPVSIGIEGRSPPPPVEASDVAIALTVDLQGVEGLTIQGMLAQDFGALVVRFDALVEARSLRFDDIPALEDALRERLPSGIRLEGLTADGMRIAAKQGLLPADALAQVEGHFRRIAEERVVSFGAQAQDFQAGFAPGTLEQPVQGVADGDPPLVVQAGATFRIPLAAGGPSRMQAASLGPALVERTLTFPLPMVEGMPTTYRILLPPGIALSDLAIEGGRAEQRTEDGRAVAYVTPEREDAQATFTVQVTTDYVVGLALPYLVFGLLLVGSVAAAAWVRKRNAALGGDEDEGEPPGQA